MSRHTLFIFITILFLLSGAFSLFHVTQMTHVREEALLNIPDPHREGKSGKQVTLPQEFVDFVKQGDGSAQGSLSAKDFSLKKLAFTACLHEVSSTTTFWKNERSEELFASSGATSTQVHFVTKEAREYASKHNITTTKKKKLWVSACLDYYDSAELKETLKKASALPN